MYVRAGRPAFARPCVGIHKSTSLMSSSLLLQQCPACLLNVRSCWSSCFCAAVCWGSIRVHLLWVHLCFSSNVLHVCWMYVRAGRPAFAWPCVGIHKSTSLMSYLCFSSNVLHVCWMYVRAGRPAFARPCVGIHKSTSLMSSSLLLQQCPACLLNVRSCWSSCFCAAVCWGSIRVHLLWVHLCFSSNVLHVCWMYVRAGRPAFARPCVGDP